MHNPQPCIRLNFQCEQYSKNAARRRKAGNTVPTTAHVLRVISSPDSRRHKQLVRQFSARLGKLTTTTTTDLSRDTASAGTCIPRETAACPDRVRHGIAMSSSTTHQALVRIRLQAGAYRHTHVICETPRGVCKCRRTRTRSYAPSSQLFAVQRDLLVALANQEGDTEKKEGLSHTRLQIWFATPVEWKYHGRTSHSRKQWRLMD